MPECVICYNAIDVAGPASASSSYMISPCDHLFHRECLGRWMDIKLECPVCRQPLPST
jgi:transmembrane E3 ubiquitin-protein ligase